MFNNTGLQEPVEMNWYLSMCSDMEISPDYTCHWNPQEALYLG